MGNVTARIGASASTHEIAAYKRALRLDPCAYCGGPSDVLDHVTPNAESGSDAWWNLTAACARCNGRKNTLGLVSWLAVKAQRDTSPPPEERMRVEVQALLDSEAVLALWDTLTVRAWRAVS